MNLPPAIADAVAPLFAELPLEAAMPELVVTRPADAQAIALAAAAVEDPAIRANPSLAAGIWMLVDDLDRSHAISQSMPDATGSFWHGIMHRREGDFSNSHYWFRQAGHHPAMAAIEGYDSHAFIDEIAAGNGRADSKLVDLQRREWAALFAWCAEQ